MPACSALHSSKKEQRWATVKEMTGRPAACLQTTYILFPFHVRGKVLATLFPFSTPFKTIRTEPATVVHVCNSSKQKAEAGGWRV